MPIIYLSVARALTVNEAGQVAGIALTGNEWHACPMGCTRGQPTSSGATSTVATDGGVTLSRGNLPVIWASNLNSSLFYCPSSQAVISSGPFRGTGGLRVVKQEITAVVSPRPPPWILAVETLQADAMEITLRAERQLGKLLAETPKNAGAKGTISGSEKVPLMDTTSTLADMGIDKKPSARSQKIASIEVSSFEALVDSAPEFGAVLEPNSSRYPNRHYCPNYQKAVAPQMFTG